MKRCKCCKKECREVVMRTSVILDDRGLHAATFGYLVCRRCNRLTIATWRKKMGLSTWPKT